MSCGCGHTGQMTCGCCRTSRCGRVGQMSCGCGRKGEAMKGRR